MSSNSRQRIVRVAGARRAKLTPAPGSSAEPVPSDDESDAAPASTGEAAASGPNDEQLRRDVPPHY